MNAIYHLSLKTLKVLFFIISGLLFLCSLFYTSYSVNMDTQLVLFKKDNILVEFFSFTLYLFFFFCIYKLCCKNIKKRKQILFVIVLSILTLIGFLLIIFGKTVPAADAMSIYSIAENLSLGNTSVIHPTDSYLSYYPQQIGLVAFYEILIRILNLFAFSFPAYHIIKCIYVLLTLIIVFIQYKTVQLLFDNEKIQIIYLLFALANMPLIMYSSFVYGEIPSFALLSIGLYIFFKWLKNTKNKQVGSNLPLSIFSFFALVFSVMLRKNSLILIIAVLIIAFLHGIYTKHYFILLWAGILFIGALSILPLTQKYYELRAENTLKSGVTALSYIAMGTQESSRAAGWYNGFNFNTYQQTNMDTENTNEISKNALKERISYFIAHPNYTFTFYKEKFLSQWADGTYASRQATLATFGGRSKFLNELYEGKYSNIYIAHCNIYQNILYLGVFLCSILALKKKSLLVSKELPFYLGFLFVLGGLLFHLFWEANARYIFPYSLMLLPYSAFGIQYLFDGISQYSMQKNINK